MDGTATALSPEDSLRTAQESEVRYQLMYKNLQRETSELLSLPVTELLGVDIEQHLSEATNLHGSYATTSVLISELMVKLKTRDAESIEDGMFTCKKKIKKHKDELTRLRAIKDAYKGSLSMKRLIGQLSSVDNLTGPACQSDIQALRKYVVGFGSDLLSLRCPDVQSIYDEVIHLSAAIFERSEKQLLDAMSTASTSTDAESTTAPTRRKLKELPLPTYSGDLAEWRSFLRLFLEAMEDSFTDNEKLSYLKDCLKDREALEIVQQAIINGDSFAKVEESLKLLLDRPREVFLQALNLIYKGGNIDYDCSGLSTLVNDFRKVYNTLQRYGDQTMAQVLTATAELRMTDTLRKEWILHQEDPHTISQFEELLTFADTRCKLLTATTSKVSASVKQPKPISQHKKNVLQVQRTTVSDKCLYCQLPHVIYVCSDFKKLSVSARKEQARRKGLCFNCLCKGHTINHCTSKNRCKQCEAKHHTLLHQDSTSAIEQSTTEPPPAATTVASATHPPTSRAMCLPRTVLALASSGSYARRCRAQLDTGAMLSLVTRRLAYALHAKKIKGTAITISGIGGEQYSTSEVEIRLQVLHSDEYIDVRASVVDSIPTCSTSRRFDGCKHIPAFKDLHLSDPGYSPGSQLDMLLGISHCNVCSLPNVIVSADKSFRAEETIFGWAVGGSSPVATGGASSTCLKMITYHDDISEQLQRFWSLEEVPGEPTLYTDEEKAAVTHFQDTHKRSPNGRYIVGLPRREPRLELGRSRHTALRRYKQNERALKSKGRWDSFHQGIEEYLQLGHAEKVPQQDLDKPSADIFYLPMHGVVKDSTTTKLRIVFDGSAKTTSGYSLNDILLSGPSLYPLLSTVLTKFRRHRIGMVSDISKMFREVALLPEEYDLHRFLHRDETGEIVDFRMNRLTFGVTTSPYLATQVLRQLAQDHREEYPNASAIVPTNFYVDDCLVGADTLPEAIGLRNELNALFSRAGMTLRKWRSNSMDLLQTIPDSLKEQGSLDICLSPAEHGKALGLRWNSVDDTLSVSVPTLPLDSLATKRSVCSAIARTFDVMGWYTPAILPAKLLLQELWNYQLAWDDPLPDDLQHRWRCWAADLDRLNQHTIPRYTGCSTEKIRHRSLHGFSDASSKAYGCVIYLRIVLENTKTLAFLITAKSKVAPLKVQTIPRLELCGALLLSNLLSRISVDLEIPEDSVYAWTDSSVVLGWLRTPAYRLKVFVAHRVSRIVETVPAQHWRYVHTTSNPPILPPEEFWLLNS